MSTSLLRLEGVTVRFGGVVAVSGVDLAVEAGTLVGLIGPNGAGKTTLVDAITGFVKASEGTVTFDDVVLNKASAARRTRMGLARTFQGVELLPDLSVRDNILLAANPPRWYDILRDVVSFTPEPVPAAAQHAIDLLDIEAILDRMPDQLSGAERKLVAIARALALDPRLLLLDEPAAGLDTHETAAFAGTLRRLVDSGLGVLLIDHDTGLVFSSCDQVYVLDFGQVIASGPAAELQKNQTVIDAYLGDMVSGAEA